MVMLPYQGDKGRLINPDRRQHRQPRQLSQHPTRVVGNIPVKNLILVPVFEGQRRVCWLPAPDRRPVFPPGGPRAGRARSGLISGLPTRIATLP
jgi:hypothetical protein